MVKKRLIASLLMRDGLMVQSLGFSQYLPIGHPRFPIEFVVKWDVDEIILLDISARKNGSGPNSEIIKLLSHFCFVPLTVGGGIESVADVRKLIRAGADKVSINTYALKRPQIISEVAAEFGSQCVVVSMDCRRGLDGRYWVYGDSGRYESGIEAIEWAARSQQEGAGEILVNSIDRDGSRVGYDIELIKSITSAVNIPVIACGGVGSFTHFTPGILEGGADAVAASNIFHHVEHSTILAKAHLLRDGVDVRMDSKVNYENRAFDDCGRLLMHDSFVLDGLDSVSRKVL
ncbi:imidazole glycerol phosphate synthase subunit HisF [Polynucleobacter sp. UB-Raua-W9]|uniref:imidazole glycerol phosphate synthase subunit HisF n=1 Tax=Polynucleobacter sp. UB-Raua-W9 TaxID=1819736 RepID=UPI002112068E|nr:imidazole glycerol phosphate synthase cyclase subunit [Polynucleobacter sp. UB-Raua-W9]QWD72729.1 imidazole glycerol phosphate synthase subunit HisF [Polynucleobacter sp. UB-Raua-W9]